MIGTALRGLALSSTALVAVYIISVPAQAQTPPTVRAAGSGGDARVEEIIVTARRREEALKDVPASVAVVTGEAIERQGIVDFQDLALAIPNVIITENTNIPGRTGVTIRGVPGRAGIYVDDVFVGDNSGISGLLVDIDRIEVLRGPQGTLFGRNALSGAINTVTRKPGAEPFGTILAKVGEDHLRQVSAAVGGPLGDKVAAKVSAGLRERESEYEVRGFGSDFNPEDGGLLLGQLFFQPAESLEVLLSADYQKDNVTTGMSDAVRDFGPPGALFRVAARDGNGSDRILPGRNLLNTMDRTNKSAFARVDWSPGFGTVTSITAIRRIEFLFDRDGDGSEFDQISGRQPVDYEQFSQEFRVAADLSANFDILAGVYYFKDDRKSEDFNRLGADYLITVVPALAPLAPALVPGGTPGGITPARLAASPLLRQLTGLPVTIPELGSQTTFDRNEIKSLAFFGSATWRPAESWEVVAGLRFTREEITASFGRSVDGTLRAFVPTVPQVNLPTSEDDDFSPSGSISYRPTEDVTLYATYGKGFRSGGYNLAPGGPVTDVALEAANRKFKPEKLTSYEAGVKTSLLDGRVAANAAVFTLDYEDFQRSFYRIDPVTGPQTLTFNTTASVTGFEIDVGATVTDALSISGSYGYQESKYDEYRNAPINTTRGLRIIDLTGAPLPFTPEHSATFRANYAQPIASDWDFLLGGEVQYRSSYRVTDTDGTDPETVVGATTLLNASIGLESEPNGLSIVLRGTNLSDEVYRTGLDFNTFTGTVFQSLSSGRTWSVEVRKTF